MAMPKQSVQSVERTALKIEMARRNLSVSRLAKLARFSPRRVTNLLCGHDSTWPIRAAINRALQEKFFSKPTKTNRPRRAGPAAPAPPMFDNIKTLLPKFLELLREQEVLDKREAEANRDLAEATINGPLDNPQIQRKVASARTWLDLCNSRRANVEKELKSLASAIRAANKRVSEEWDAIVKAQMAEKRQQILEATAPFFLGEIRRHRDAIRVVSFPILDQIERAFTPNPGPPTSPAAILRDSENLMSHIRRHSRILGLALPEEPDEPKTQV